MASLINSAITRILYLLRTPPPSPQHSQPVASFQIIFISRRFLAPFSLIERVIVFTFSSIEAICGVKIFWSSPSHSHPAPLCRSFFFSTVWSAVETYRGKLISSAGLSENTAISMTDEWKFSLACETIIFLLVRVSVEVWDPTVPIYEIMTFAGEGSFYGTWLSAGYSLSVIMLVAG